MGVSTVRGLAKIREYLGGHEGGYAIIGGTACDVVMSDADLPFRATRDIDLVLLLDQGQAEVGSALWRLISAGGYRFGWKGSEQAHFYRFTDPTDAAFPSMIELFSKAPGFLPEDYSSEIAPLPLDDEASSLSAILLDDDFYSYLLAGRQVLDGLSVLDTEHLIPFKAEAHLDLTRRKADGQHVNAKDLKKHKNDVFRLLQLINPDEHAELPERIAEDVRAFCKQVEKEGVRPEQLGVSLGMDEALSLLRSHYGLE